MKRNHKRLVGITLLFAHLFFGHTASAISGSNYVPINNHSTPMSIGSHLQYIIDTTNNFVTIQNIGSLTNLSQSDRDIPNYNAGTNPIWYKCAFINYSDDEQFLINVANPSLDNITFYNLSNNKWDSIQYGNNSPFNNRKYAEPNFLFDIKIAKYDTAQIVFKLTSSDISRFPLSIGKPEVIFNQIKQKDTVLNIYIGLMLVMLFYNLFIYFTVKDNSYLYYVSYIITVLLTQIGVFGIPFQYLWPNSPWIEERSLLIFPVLSGVTGMAFMQQFLRSKDFIPKFNKIATVLYFVYAIAIALVFVGQGSVSFKLTQLNASLASIFMLISAIKIQRKGYRPATFFLIAWSIFLCGIILFVLSDTGVIEYNTFTFYIMPVGSALEVVLLSFALADKINTYREETAAAQLESLNQAKENERIITQQNLVLEGKVSERTHELNQSNQELSKTLFDLKETQTQLVESEKMASLGQLTAGIAHEINNPINFVTSNVKPLRRDVDILLDLMTKIETIATSDISTEDKQKQIKAIKTEYDFDYLTEEVEFLLRGINEGSTRTAEIVKGLRIFSRVDEDDLKKADVNEGLDSTIIIVNNQLNGKIKITRNYANLPLAECYPGKLNQVFLNMISNAIYAIHKKFEGESGGEIIITTQASENIVSITFADNGIGMSEATQHKLFEPFFTTKPVGEGTGLGLSISYNTIKKHHGTISVKSESDKGTEFKIEIPIIQINP
jgi:signal transduction histidine kinase